MNDSSQSLSTGKASKLLSVTPDTILKWIKLGKLPAVRTAGGHYRVAAQAIAALLQTPELSPAPSGPLADRGLLYCWEFFAEDGSARAGCQECLVFRAHALRCFEMNHLSRELGFKGGSCAASCEDCAYFHYHLGRPFKVLVITDNPACRESLAGAEQVPNLELQFVSCEYECSLVIDRFRPDFVVVDCAMPEEKCQELCYHLANDPRIPNTTIILATPARRRALSLPGAIRIRNPISWTELGTHLSRVRMCPSIGFPAPEKGGSDGVH